MFRQSREPFLNKYFINLIANKYSGVIYGEILFSSINATFLSSKRTNHLSNHYYFAVQKCKQSRSLPDDDRKVSSTAWTCRAWSDQYEEAKKNALTIRKHPSFA